MQSFEELVAIIKKLRNPISGCPWDIKQTHETLKKYLIEESYEVIDAIENNGDLKDELGDILLQVLLHSQIACDENNFNINDVIINLNKKLIDRHPHVFGNVKVNDENDVVNNWNKIKKNTNKLKLTPSLPSLIKIKKLSSINQKKEIDFGDDEVANICSFLYEKINNGIDLEIEISKRITQIYDSSIEKE